MCRQDTEIGHVRLSRCPHGTFHLNLGPTTLHLTARELLLVGQAVNRWVQAHPKILEALDEIDGDSSGRDVWVG